MGLRFSLRRLLLLVTFAALTFGFFHSGGNAVIVLDDLDSSTYGSYIDLRHDDSVVLFVGTGPHFLPKHHTYPDHPLTVVLGGWELCGKYCY